MNNTRQFAIQTLVLILVLNAALLGAIYVVAGAALAGLLLPILGIGAVVTLVLWWGVQRLGRQLLEHAPPAELPKKEAAPPQVAPPAAPPETSALQILSLLQRKGRFIDFLQEDLSPHSDAQIGAAVRGIHEGCKQVLAEHITLEPIIDDEEGQQVTVEPGFDAHEIRLTGNITGDPPFKGALRHCGWRVVQVDLPERLQTGTSDRILAAAEVEVT